jgi:MYXO-CTERM domain-containing protein
MHDVLRTVLRVGAAGIVATAAGCSSRAPTEDIGSSSQAITISTILSRADEWVVAQLQYCQSPNGADDSIDPSCSAVCTRESNPAWDPYRSDCSGFVSWAWGLAPPGLTTDEFAPADMSVSYTINGSDLQPGDALNIPGDHIVLFVSWQTPGSVANFYEEPGCSSSPPYAHAFSSAVTLSGSNVTIAYEGKTFTAIRFTGVTGDAGAGSGTDAGATNCYSDTLMASVPMNTCVQSSADSQWYQCDSGSWVDRSSDPAACVGLYPLGSTYDAGTDAGVPTAADAATTEGAPDAATAVTADAATTRVSEGDAGGAAMDPTPGVKNPGGSTASGSGNTGSSGCSVTQSDSGSGPGAWLIGAALIASRRRRQLRS